MVFYEEFLKLGLFTKKTQTVSSIKLPGGVKYFLIFIPTWKMIQFEEHIFQMGWFNHQPVKPL